MHESTLHSHVLLDINIKSQLLVINKILLVNNTCVELTGLLLDNFPVELTACKINVFHSVTDYIYYLLNNPCVKQII